MLCPKILVYKKEPNLNYMVIRDQKPRRETPIERKRKMKSYFCMPRLRGSSSSRKSTRLITPMSLLDRFREAVFRLIMLSALSKATTVHENRTSSGLGHTHHHHHRNHKSYYSYDPHHSEAVADCIEFIKKSATADENRNSATSNSSTDGAPGPELVIPLPVM